MSLFTDCQKLLSDLQVEVTQTSKNIINRAQQWRRLSTVPSYSCDVILVFKSNVSDIKIYEIADIIKTRVPQLIVEVTYHHTSEQHALYLKSLYRDLLSGAEELRLKKRLLPEHGGTLREFSLDELNLFDHVLDEHVFLSTSERSNIVLNFLHHVRIQDGDAQLFSSKFVNNQCFVSALQSGGYVKQIFPLHEQAALKTLMHKWIMGWNFYQPLDEIKDYFGTKIALYFAWLGHYTIALLFPLLFFIFDQIFGYISDPNKSKTVPNDQTCYFNLPMAIFILIWTFLFLEHWQIDSAYLTFRWGSCDKPILLLEEPRPMFEGKLKLCPITHRIIRTYPTWRRNVILIFITGPIVLLSMFLVVVITWSFVQFQTKISMYTSNHEFSIKSSIFSSLPSVYLALAIAALDVGYRKIARKLTNYENHRLETEYYNHYVGKLILLQFVNSFYSLFYTAFYLENLELLRQQILTLLFTRQILGNVQEIFLPLGRSKLHQFWLSLKYEQKRRNYNKPPTANVKVEQNKLAQNDESTTCTHRLHNYVAETNDLKNELHIVQGEKEATLPRFEDPTDDFLEMLIQFGYVSMFTCIFPWAGLLAFVNNLIEIRGDAFKLCTTYQRPFAKPANSIGVWQLALDVMSYIAVMVNIGLFGISGKAKQMFPGYSTKYIILLLIAIEHAIFFLRNTISAFIPRIPKSVEEEIAKLEHRRREALKTIEREAMKESQRLASFSENSLSYCFEDI